MATEKELKEYEELKEIKTTDECPEIKFFPRRIGLGYKIEYKHIDKSLKFGNRLKPFKTKPLKKLKSTNDNNSEDSPKRGSKK